MKAKTKKQLMWLGIAVGAYALWDHSQTGRWFWESAPAGAGTPPPPSTPPTRTPTTTTSGSGYTLSTASGYVSGSSVPCCSSAQVGQQCNPNC